MNLKGHHIILYQKLESKFYYILVSKDLIWLSNIPKTHCKDTKPHTQGLPTIRRHKLFAFSFPILVFMVLFIIKKSIKF